MAALAGRILTKDGPVCGRITIENGRIADISASAANDGPLIVPGFIDLHCHGGDGDDIMDGGLAARRIARFHAQSGTTAMLATTMTAEPTAIKKALLGVAEAMADPAVDGSDILGVHLEGPFISPEMLGAQPPQARKVDRAFLEDLLSCAPVKVITFAPEADEADILLAVARERGIRAQLGHSPCRYETAERAFRHGASGATHLFNAMSALHHRAPGLVGAALAHAGNAEIIPDLMHVHPGAIRVALRAIPGVYAVTDASRATGAPDGIYPFGEITAQKCGNGLRLADGTLAGSCLTMLQAFRNFIEVGLEPAEAARRCATVAADYLGLTDRGRIARDAVADLVVLSSDLTLEDVLIRGKSANG